MKSRKQKAEGGSVLVLCILLAGCSFFSKTKSSIYSLDRVPGTVSNARGAPIAINAVELPPGLDRKEIVVRKANNQLDVRGTQQWSATLGQLVLHTLAFDLADRLPQGMMILPGETKPAAVRPIDIAFEDLSAGPDARVVLDARVNKAHEHIEVPIPSLDSANVATGISQALGTLADRIVAGLTVQTKASAAAYSTAATGVSTRRLVRVERYSSMPPVIAPMRFDPSEAAGSLDVASRVEKRMPARPTGMALMRAPTTPPANIGM